MSKRKNRKHSKEFKLELIRQHEEDGVSYYKLTYHGDPRYMTVMAKSGSDWREGKNIAAQIIRDML